jgi:hypothetical protein
MADASNNSPKKELLITLCGLGFFIAIAALIGLSGYFRPVAEPYVVEGQEQIDADLRARAAEYAQEATGVIPVDEPVGEAAETAAEAGAGGETAADPASEVAVVDTTAEAAPAEAPAEAAPAG